MATKYKIGSDGRYRAKVWDGTYKNGQRNYVRLSSTKSSKDLERLVTEYEHKRDNGLIVASQTISIQDYARQWREAKKGLSERATKAMYDNIIEVHLKQFYDSTFEHFTSRNIQSIINLSCDKPRTCQQLVMVLKQISKSAEADKLLPVGKTAEIFRDIQIPKYKSKEKKPLTDEQCKKVYNTLLTHDMPPRSRLFVALIYFCGLRREEALAVKIDDITDKRVKIDKALNLSSGDSEVKIPKTERSFRTVPLPPKALPIIKECLDELTPNKDGYVFTIRGDKIITKSAYDKMWKNIEKTLGFPVTAHIFRHTYCTKLCYEAYENRTISVKQIAKLLGDTDKMVTDVYSHLVEEREQTNEAITAIF